MAFNDKRAMGYPAYLRRLFLATSGGEDVRPPLGPGGSPVMSTGEYPDSIGPSVSPSRSGVMSLDRDPYTGGKTFPYPPNRDLTPLAKAAGLTPSGGYTRREGLPPAPPLNPEQQREVDYDFSRQPSVGGFDMGSITTRAGELSLNRDDIQIGQGQSPQNQKLSQSGATTVSQSGPVAPGSLRQSINSLQQVAAQSGADSKTLKAFNTLEQDARKTAEAQFDVMGQVEQAKLDALKSQQELATQTQADIQNLEQNIYGDALVDFINSGAAPGASPVNYEEIAAASGGSISAVDYRKEVLSGVQEDLAKSRTEIDSKPLAKDPAVAAAFILAAGLMELGSGLAQTSGGGVKGINIAGGEVAIRAMGQHVNRKIAEQKENREAFRIAAQDKIGIADALDKLYQGEENKLLAKRVSAMESIESEFQKKLATSNMSPEKREAFIQNTIMPLRQGRLEFIGRMEQNEVKNKIDALGKAGQLAATQQSLRLQRRGQDMSMIQSQMKARGDSVDNRVPGMVPSGEKKITNTDMKKVTEGRQSVVKMRDMLDKLINNVKEHGAEFSALAPGYSSEPVKVTEQLLKNIQLEYKEISNLGVLSGPDLKLLESITGTNLHRYGAVGENIQLLENLKNNLTQGWHSTARQHGFKEAEMFTERKPIRSLNVPR